MNSNQIESERIVMRDMTEADAQTVYEIWSNPENDKYMGDPVGSVEEVIEICRDLPESPSYLKVVVHKNDDAIIGTCCFGETDKQDEWGFGYSIHKAYWGKGFATEMVQIIINSGKNMGIRNFITDCAEENGASARVLEKCGMKLSHKSSFIQPTSKIEYVSLIYKLNLWK